MNLIDKNGSMNDINNLLKEGWSLCTVGQPEFTYEHAKWLHDGGKGNYLTVHDIPMDEDMFLRSEVSMDESMMIEGIHLNTEFKTGVKTQITRSQPGLYQVNETMEEWASKLANNLKNHNLRPIPRNEVIDIFSRDREWVNDDAMLIALAIKATENCGQTDFIGLISKDWRLARQMAKITNCSVICAHPYSVAQAKPDKIWNSTSDVSTMEFWSMLPQEKWSRCLRRPVICILDTGSMYACLQDKEIVQSSSIGYESITWEHIASWSENGLRHLKQNKVSKPCSAFIKYRLYKPISLQKRSRQSHAYSSSSRSKTRWSGPDYIPSPVATSWNPSHTGKRKPSVLKQNNRWK
jgi:hypothetical protein